MATSDISMSFLSSSGFLSEIEESKRILHRSFAHARVALVELAHELQQSFESRLDRYTVLLLVVISYDLSYDVGKLPASDFGEQPREPLFDSVFQIVHLGLLPWVLFGTALNRSKSMVKYRRAVRGPHLHL